MHDATYFGVYIIIYLVVGQGDIVNLYRTDFTTILKFWNYDKAIDYVAMVNVRREGPS